ncbi:unnamed protein product [Medioppia subpectinata]|uniref:Uncharacterized protein n=1 Tax=Medioppia subpectinata TaxID=1979941 RepID=A0A7R9KSK2_9ACAR|nr:unnamed protein product [Medioppia subpectinata]CAG2107678.1 unnamed protein product [Medioppia subpectinata]
MLKNQRKCLSEFVYESELKDLENSVKHHLKFKKNITTVPNDCTDRASVEIDFVFKEDTTNSSKYYAIYGNKQFYVEIDGITRDHLPIVHRDTQPMPIDSLFKRKMTGKTAIKEYKFVGPLYLYKIPFRPTLRELATRIAARNCHNYHQVHLHTVHQAVNRTTKHPPLTDWAIKVEDRFADRRGVRYYYPTTKRSKLYPNTKKSTLNDSMVVPTYIDAIVPGINKYNNLSNI